MIKVYRAKKYFNVESVEKRSRQNMIKFVVYFLSKGFYEHIANVDTDDLETAENLTSENLKSKFRWWINKRVHKTTPFTKTYQTRDTRPGDILMRDDDIFFIGNTGYHQIN